MRNHFMLGVVLGALIVTSPAGAQSAQTGRLEGTVTEAGAPRSVRGSVIALVRLDADQSWSRTASPDERGRYQLDSIPGGRYMVQVASPALDSLELALPAREVRIAVGRASRMDFALPSGAALRDALCVGMTLPRETVAIAGAAMDADTDRPLADATVVVSWNELKVDPTTLRSSKEERAVSVRTGARGAYRFCGLPAGSVLSLQLQHGDRAGTAVPLTVTEAEGAVARNLSLSATSAPAMATLDSLERTTAPASGAPGVDTTAMKLTGTAVVTGNVRDAARRPLDAAEVHLQNARSVATTDATGRFTLRNLPSGTQVLIVRRIGYGIAEATVELRTGRTITHDVQLVRISSLDSMRIVAQRNLFPEFEDRRRQYIFGKFLSADQIEQRKPTEVADLIATMGGFMVHGRGASAGVSTVRSAGRSCGGTEVVIDDVRRTGLNDVPPSQVAGIEAYTSGVGVPAPHRGDCGLILIWTKGYRENAALRAKAKRERAEREEAARKRAARPR